MGIDVFLQWRNAEPLVLGEKLNQLNQENIKLQLITNRGVKVWPKGLPETFCVDHWRCRFTSPNKKIDFADILALQTRLHDAGIDVVKAENLYDFDGEPGYAAVHG